MATICGKCRAQIEAEVMAVRAEDYPVPARVARKSERVLTHEPVPTASTIEAQLASAVDTDIDDDDLLQLAPVDEPKRPPATTSSEPAPALQRPAPPPTPVVMDVPAKALQTTNTARNAVIAVVAIIVAVILAAVVWSIVVPHSITPGARETTQPAK